MAAANPTTSDSVQPEEFAKITSDLFPAEAIAEFGLDKPLDDALRESITRTPPLVICHPSKQEPFVKFISQLPNLKEVDLSHSYYLTDKLITELVKHCPHIETLKIWNCLSLRDPALLEVAKLADLRDVNVGDNTHVTSTGVIEIVKNCKKLERLDFSGCPHVDGSVADAIAQYAENLTFLNAEFCVDFCTDATLKTLGSGVCKNLTHLLLMGGLISDEGITHLVHSGLKDTLRVVDLRRNIDVQQQGYDTLWEQMSLDELDGCDRNILPEKEIGAFFMLKRQLQGDG